MLSDWRSAKAFIDSPTFRALLGADGYTSIVCVQ